MRNCFNLLAALCLLLACGGGRGGARVVGRVHRDFKLDHVD
ncbi:MAG TPA: hypothetical protein VGB96_00925 [Archangium sp.]|jgi:hypothetical protein